MKELENGCFQSIIDDLPQYNGAKRLLFCQGRIFYDLALERAKVADMTTAIIRIEQLYPFNQKKLEEIINGYSAAEQFLWVQEEPYNMGAWSFLHEQIESVLSKNLSSALLRNQKLK